MAFEPSEVQTLLNLGITSSQARIYLALAKFGPLKISSIAKQSKVARPDVYRTLSSLNELGLVEQIVEAPVQFQAVPIEKGLESLLRKKTQEYDNLKKDTETLITAFKLKDTAKEIQTPASRFILIPQKDLVIRTQRENIDAAQNSIDLILTWNRFNHGTGDVFAQSLRNALNRNVKFRFLIESPPLEKAVEQTLAFTKKHSCEVRFLDKQPKTVLGIYDNNKLMVIVEPEVDLPGGSPALWTNNKSLIALVRDYFDILWLTAMEKPNYAEDTPV